MERMRAFIARQQAQLDQLQHQMQQQQAQQAQARQASPVGQDLSEPFCHFFFISPSFFFEFKSYREKVRRWLLFTRTPAQLQGPHVLSRLTGPAWDDCDGLEPRDVTTADGLNMILDTLAEAFQGEHDVSGSHAVYVSQAKDALVKSEEEGYTDVETALAALAQETDTDLEETDVQEILLAYKESRQLG